MIRIIITPTEWWITSRHSCYLCLLNYSSRWWWYPSWRCCCNKHLILRPSISIIWLITDLLLRLLLLLNQKLLLLLRLKLLPLLLLRLDLLLLQLNQLFLLFDYSLLSQKLLLYRQWIIFLILFFESISMLYALKLLVLMPVCSSNFIGPLKLLNARLHLLIFLDVIVVIVVIIIAVAFILTIIAIITI